MLHKGMTKAQPGFPQAHTSWIPRAVRRQMSITAEGNNGVCKQLLEPKSLALQLIIQHADIERCVPRKKLTKTAKQLLPDTCLS